MKIKDPGNSDVIAPVPLMCVKALDSRNGEAVDNLQQPVSLMSTLEQRTPLLHHLLLAYPLCISPALSKREAEYTLDSKQFILECWRKPEYPARTHACMRRTCKLHADQGLSCCKATTPLCSLKTHW
ncbi:hypothetical protein GOODEAATRI_021793 [Goodea atripinnis]|uniref:Uncharacterized protein n=1 Tax=Goodea atripinnis TaxID=208336 RepID=A0ABV0PQW6_9TELE